VTSVDITAGLVPAPGPGFGARLAAVEDLVATWDLAGAQAAARALLDEPALPPGDRLTARRLLAEALRELGDLDAAYDLAEAVAAQAEQAYGSSDTATVHAWAVLAAVRHDYDEWDAAEALYHRVLDSGVDESDPEAARVIRLTRVNLALLQRDRGQLPLALTMLNAAYVVHRREYGADDLDTIRIAAELAALHHADGNVPASRRLFTLAHAAARSRLGNRHPFTKAVEWELAAVEPPMPESLLPPAAPAIPEPVPAADDDAAGVQPEPPAATSPAADGGLAIEDDPDRDIDDALRWGPSEDDPDRDFDDDALRWGPPDDDEPVETAPTEVVGAAAVVHVASSAAVAGHPEVVGAAVAGERRVVVPLKAVAGLAVGALVIAAVSVLWPSGGAPERTAGQSSSAGAAGSAGAGASGPAGAAGAAGSGGGAGQGGAGAGGEPVRVRDLRLRDDGTALAVTWTALRSRVVVALSRAGGPAVVVAEVPPGTTSYVVKGVDPAAAYCVVVGPVDAVVAVTPGTSVCTGER
jgi:tetratricopeptide (TPR) repeat protein